MATPIQMLRLAVMLGVAVLPLASAARADALSSETGWIPMTERSLTGTRELKLEATLYRPAAPAPSPVLLFNHGSTGAGRQSPKQTVRYAEVAQFFAERASRC